MFSYLSAVPFRVREGLDARSMIVRFAPWAPPPFSGIDAVRQATGEAVLVVVSETPLHLCPWLSPVGKEELEQLHLERFATDWALARGERPYQGLARGGDPPDFTAQAPSGARQIDCVQFALESRRVVHGLFAGVRAALSAADPNLFAHLRGLLVHVWARTARGDLELPLRAPMRREFIEALAAYRWQPEMGAVVGAALPPQMPPLGVESTAAGWQFYGTPLQVAVPASPFFGRMGFELAFAYSTEHTPEAGWAELARVVAQHDKPTVDELVLTVGGPDRAGYVYPSEEAVFDHILAHASAGALAATHVGRAFAHSWGTGRIVQLLPEVQQIAAALSPGVVPAHYPLAAR